MIMIFMIRLHPMCKELLETKQMMISPIQAKKIRATIHDGEIIMIAFTINIRIILEENGHHMITMITRMEMLTKKQLERYSKEIVAMVSGMYQDFKNYSIKAIILTS